MKSLAVFFGAIAFMFTAAVVLLVGFVAASIVARVIKPRDADPPFDPELDEIDDDGPGEDVDGDPDRCECDTCNERNARGVSL